MTHVLFEMLIGSDKVGPVLKTVHEILFCEEKLEDTEIINFL